MITQMALEKLKNSVHIRELLDLDHLITGDMPGDKIEIGPSHIEKTESLLPVLFKMISDEVKQGKEKLVVSVFGGSGVGKSETGTLISNTLKALGISTYLISGDNYPHRIPMENDAERLRVYREAGIKGLVRSGKYTKAANDRILALQAEEKDMSIPELESFPNLAYYQESGEKGLKSYLGTQREIDFQEINEIIAKFKDHAKQIYLKRMGRSKEVLWYDSVDFSDVEVLLIEWTHGNNANLKGVDIPIFLYSTPEETLAHRRSRNRDGGVDSPFTTLVLSLEQALLESQRSSARIIVTKSGDVHLNEK